MLWPRLLLVAVLAGLGPVGCGFHAIHATSSGAVDDSPVGTELARVRVDPISNRVGQQVRNALVERLSPRGEPADPLYTLKIVLTESTADVGYRRDNYATLGNLSLSATIQLRREGLTLLNETASTVASFDYLGPRYASVVMERDARERAATQIADDIRGRVAAAIERYQSNPNDPRYRRRDMTIWPDDSTAAPIIP
ncbi:LPS assembly lipoprotein LptE [Magnetospirillum molischianum]|uniref:Predicted secreted protein n=1 Tax=Magnetospirillum molischianum DSM 120 TaxID=1150626 RepID=H8FT18_MAGML|nr:LPS assembly lipoprotein LptE [Magnetospirillum molischianum]CCG41506.1 Predicted secreted protein [Magnetospirillum molischianum DSM 120]